MLVDVVVQKVWLCGDNCCFPRCQFTTVFAWVDLSIFFLSVSSVYTLPLVKVFAKCVPISPAVALV